MSGWLGPLLALAVAGVTLAVYLFADSSALTGALRKASTVQKGYHLAFREASTVQEGYHLAPARARSPAAGSARAGKYNLTQLSTSWNAVPRLVGMLLTDLPEDLRPRGRDCDVFFAAGWKHSLEILRPLDEARLRPASNPRVALIVNIEYPTNEWAWGRYPRDVVAHGVILGNWWNSTHMDYRDEHVSSLWVPFGSLSFADRVLSTPMDLMDRGNASRRSWLQACTRRYIDEAGLPKAAAYQQRNCRTTTQKRRAPWENYRDPFWDRLNRRMLEELGTRGAALGRCNGAEKLGARLMLERKQRHFSPACRGGLDFDQSVAEYAHFKVVLALENTINDGGYITEKLVNALLSGAVPVYAGSSRVSDLFRPGSYFLLRPGENDAEVVGSVVEALRNESLYAAMLRREAVSGDVMRRFFSWHPAVWPAHGDSLRRRIVGELLRHCK